jgi:hypothetical protein
MEDNIASIVWMCLLHADIRAAKDDMVLSSMDITSLYPNIPLDDALRVIRVLLMELPHLYASEQVEEIVSLLKLVLKTNVVNFKGRLFLQIKGGAMGTPVLVCVAILYMFFHERDLVSEFRARGWLMFYHRYIDDIFSLFTSLAAHDLFFRRFNSLNPNSTCTGNVGDSVVWLDLVISKGKRFALDGRLDIQLFQKHLNLFLYLPFNSNHSYKSKLGFVTTELVRYVCNNSCRLNYLCVRKQFLLRLRARRMPFSLLLKCFAKVSDDHRNHYLYDKNTAAGVINNPKCPSLINKFAASAAASSPSTSFLTPFPSSVPKVPPKFFIVLRYNDSHYCGPRYQTNAR